MSHRVRAGIAALAASDLVVGLWALLAPRSFYRDFPTAEAGWVSSLPPYNEHLVRDVGGFSLAFAVLLGWAVARRDGAVARAGLVASLVWAVPHFVFHVAHLDGLSAPSAVALTAALGLGVGLPLAIVAGARGTR